MRRLWSLLLPFVFGLIVFAAGVAALLLAPSLAMQARNDES